MGSISMTISNDVKVGLDLDEFGAIELPNSTDLAILKAIGSEDAQQFSFQGIRRKLGLHQETLSRALHRLQRDGYVRHFEHAYAISEKGQSTLSEGGKISNPVRQKDPYSVVLLHSILPEDLDIQTLVDSISYKWFGNLRWLGSSQKSRISTLSWITNETGITISVRIQDSTLTIETDPGTSGAISEATRSAYELFDNISKALKNTVRSRVLRPSTAS